MKTLRIILIKPGKYAIDGGVERFTHGFMPNASLYHIASLTPAQIGDHRVELHRVDEYVWDNLDYLDLLQHQTGTVTLLALVGVQSHQFHRALDLAAFARHRGVEHCAIGGPHPMTCDTTDFHDCGISFALAEAELIWMTILEDAIAGQLQPLYSDAARWKKQLDETVLQPPLPDELQRYVLPMFGIYPMRGCPYRCNYCSVVKIAGHQVRGIGIESTMASLMAAEKAGVRYVAFVSDNFNKYPQVHELLDAMIDEKLNLRFFCQCDTHIVKQPELFEKLHQANCFEMFVGVESFNRKALKAAHKFHNFPKRYQLLADQCQHYGIRAHFSNIMGFPEDTRQDILYNLECLKQLNPAVASFYVLTPIPGTEQYDEFKANELIVETNLDRFDTTCLVWEHPHLTKTELESLLYESYVDYYRHLMQQKHRIDEFPEFTIFSRYVASKGIHPMAGGTGRIVLDSNRDYLDLRKKTFDIANAPLPESLGLSAEDDAFNRGKWNAAAGEKTIQAG